MNKILNCNWSLKYGTDWLGIGLNRMGLGLGLGLGLDLDGVPSHILLHFYFGFALIDRTQNSFFDWYVDFNQLGDLLRAATTPDSKVLNLGCGNSSTLFVVLLVFVCCACVVLVCCSSSSVFDHSYRLPTYSTRAG